MHHNPSFGSAGGCTSGAFSPEVQPEKGQGFPFPLVGSRVHEDNRVCDVHTSQEGILYTSVRLSPCFCVPWSMCLTSHTQARHPILPHGLTYSNKTPHPASRPVQAHYFTENSFYFFFSFSYLISDVTGSWKLI